MLGSSTTKNVNVYSPSFAVADFVDVLGDLRIFDELAARANAAHDRLADARLFRLRQDRIRGTADVG
jgi:hypothetical protein